MLGKSQRQTPKLSLISGTISVAAYPKLPAQVA
jgi:hypothetical protein